MTFFNYKFTIKLASTVGIFMNSFNIYFLTRNRNGLNLKTSFVDLLILLAIFDTLFLVTGIGLFGLPAVSDWYYNSLFKHILPKG